MKVLCLWFLRLTLHLIVSVFVTIFRSQPAVTVLIPVSSFCFIIYSLIMADLKAKRVQ